MDSTRFPTHLLTAAFFLISLASCGRPAPRSEVIAIVGGRLIDGTGRAPVADAAILIEDGRFRQVGTRREVAIPEGAEVIEADGATILPGLIDGHCHYEEWADELYLAFGVTTCPDISGNDPEPMALRRTAIASGSVRGPRLWFTGLTVDGLVPPGMSDRRRSRSGIVVETPEEAREAVQSLVEQGVDGLKFYDYLAPEVAEAAAEEAHRLGRPVFGHSLDIFAAAEAGYDTVEHFWAVVYTSMQDPERKEELDRARNAGEITTGEFHVYFEPEGMDDIVRVLADNDIHWSPAWATWFRPYSTRAAEMKADELALIRDPRFGIPSEEAMSVENLYAAYENATPERQAELLEGYRKLEEFVRRFVAAGGKIHAGSDPNRVIPAYGLHVELNLLVEAGLTPVQVIQSASLNVAEAWRKDSDYGSVEPGKVADLAIVRGDLTRDISITQSFENIEMVWQGGRRVAGSR